MVPKNYLRLVVVSLATLLLMSFAIYEATTWNIGEDYVIKFTSDNPSGVFTELEGDIVFDPEDLSTAKFDIRVPVASIDTGNGLKNKNARGKNWFEADAYPTIAYTSTSFAIDAEGYLVTGDLTMHGTTRSVVIPFTFEADTFSGAITVNRLDYGIGGSKGFASKVPEELLVEIRVPVSANP